MSKLPLYCLLSYMFQILELHATHCVCIFTGFILFGILHFYGSAHTHTHAHTVVNLH